MFNGKKSVGDYPLQLLYYPKFLNDMGISKQLQYSNATLGLVT